MNKKWSRSYIYRQSPVKSPDIKNYIKNPIVYSANEAYKIQNKDLLDQINSK